MGSENKHAGDRPRGKWIKRFVVATVVIAVVICVSVLVIPEIISKTSMRDIILQEIVGDPNLKVSSSGASFGLFSPLTIDDLSLKSSDGELSISIARLTAEKSWLSLWLSTPELGTLDIQRPHVDVTIDDDGDEEESDENEVQSFPTFKTVLSQGSLIVREKGVQTPVIDAGQINVTIHTEQRNSSSVLIAEPITLAKNQVLTEAVCNEGLQFVAPVLSDEVSVEGQYSFELTKIQLTKGHGAPESESEASQIEGVVTLHRVTLGFRNEVTRRLIMVAAELMEIGEVPDRIQIAENAEIKFHLSHGGVVHEGMAMILPSFTPGFSVRTAGSVAIDETLDLNISFQIPLAALSDSPLARELAESPLQLQVTGTIDQPVVVVPPKQAWRSLPKGRLLSPGSSSDEKELATRIINVLDDLPSSVLEAQP